ncbi:uncharacterized protein PHACADRAFT_213947 [Phanerochaete carnosa HHB-10118-sp]|uniref:Glycoside hydrolase family 76 protein n=1 Tax=Phanerochaete carnosa (strain HHB-10118-sp) TaxID=650164 RepID=K5WIX1_PHACS|nr:uncharacterized protein PHACADRAFT_213947 [Phanerochaete carnosa HHB-10118-sp]EKM50197.1 hypothetical protein PHACADRAFT_213947 [Phanerochaete carnosa HHB-10118-sp]
MISRLYLLYAVLLTYLQVAHVVWAQTPSFAVPTTWKRYNLATAIIDTVKGLFNASDGVIDELGFSDTSSMLIAISLMDRINGTSLYQDLVINSLTTAINPSPPTSTTALALATSIWEQLYVYFIQPSDAAQGSHATRNVLIASTCNGLTTAGGLFYFSGTNQTNTDVNVETLGAFMALSSYLATATSNQTYATAAELSAEFIWNQLYNGMIIMDTITVANCATNDVTLSYNSGKTIEGLADLAQRNSVWTSRLESLVSAVIPFPDWTASNGTNSEGTLHLHHAERGIDPAISDQVDPQDVEQSSFLHSTKAFLIRGLYAAWNHTDPTSDMAKLIEAYITVQYNTLQDLATSPGTNMYSSAWSGPPIPVLVPWGQLDALEVMRSEFGFALKQPTTLTSQTSSTSPESMSSTSTTTSTRSPSTQTAEPSHKQSDVAAIVGGTVGGVVFLALLVAILLICRKRRKQDEEETIRQKMEFAPVPYTPDLATLSMAPASSTPPTSTTTLRAFASKPTYLRSTAKQIPDSALRANEEEAAFVEQPMSPGVSQPSGSEGPSTASPHPAASPTSNPQDADEPEHDLTALLAQLSNILATAPHTQGDAPPAYDD